MIRRLLDKPEWAWPAFVVLLLCSSPVLMFGVIRAARSDGGAQVVDAYYSKAIAWDSIATARDRIRRANWTTRLEFEDDRGLLVVSDSLGAPVAGLRGRVDVSRPQTSDVLLADTLTVIADGRYAFELPARASGLWDFRFELLHREDLHLVDVRAER